MPTSRLSLLLVFLCFGATARSAAVANGAERAESIAPGKFIPTFAVKYGGTSGWPTREEAARFDLLDVSASVGHSRVFASEHGNTWQTLKRLNPHILVFLVSGHGGRGRSEGKGWPVK